jgi:uncharacterized membrane protein YhfC
VDELMLPVFVLTGFVEVALPLLVGYWVVTRYRVKPRLLGYAAALYIAAQLVLLVPVAAGRGFINAAITPFIFAAISGLVEEALRYLALKHVLKDVKGWFKAVGFGVGWGGVQAVLLGLGLVMTAFYIQYIDSLDEATLNELNVTQDFIDQVGELRQESARISLLDAVTSLIAVSSFFIMQLAFSVAVTFAVRDGRGDLFVKAMAAHCGLNVLTAYLTPLPEVYSITVFIVGGALGLYALGRLRD